MAWTTPGTAVAGAVLTSSFWNEQVRDNMVELAPFSAAWTSYVPALTGSVSNPNIGSTGSSTGSYLKVGKLVVYRIRIVTGGTGVAAGSGEYYFSLPFAVKAAQFDAMGSGWVYADNPLAFAVVAADPSPGSSRIRLIASNAAIVQATNFEAVNASSIYVISGAYETT